IAGMAGQRPKPRRPGGTPVNVFIHHDLDHLVEHHGLHLCMHVRRIYFAEHTPDVEIVFLLWILDRRVDHRPRMLHRLIAVRRRGKNIQRVAEYRPPELVRFVHRRLCDLWLQALEQFDTVDTFLDQSAHRFSRFVFAVDNNAGALAPKCTGTLGRRSIDDIGRGPDPRSADGTGTYTFPLRDDPIHRIVGDIRAGDHTVGEVDFSHPVAIMTVTVN